MRRIKAHKIKSDIERPLFISELDYTATVHNVADDPEMSNYQVAIHPEEMDADSQADGDHKASMPDDIVNVIQEDYPDVDIKSIFGRPHPDAEQCLYFALNDGKEYEVKHLYDHTREGISFTNKMKQLTKALKKSELDRHLTGPWKYVNCPPHPSIHSSRKPFRPVDHYPGVSGRKEDLEVFQPSNTIEFLRVPEPLKETVRLSRGQITSIRTGAMGEQKTGWTGNVNYVSIVSGKIESNRHRYNNEVDESNYPDTGYYLSGAFADPTVTASIDTIVPKIYEAMSRTATAVRLNTQVEQVWANSSIPAADGLSGLSESSLATAVEDIEFDDQRIPIRQVHQVGQKTIGKVAREFGTYHRLAEATTDDIDNSSQINHVRFDPEQLISTAQIAVEAHRIWRQATDAGIPQDSIDELLEFPKEHPQLSIYSPEAGRPEQTGLNRV